MFRANHRKTALFCEGVDNCNELLPIVCVQVPPEWAFVGSFAPCNLNSKLFFLINEIGKT
jgi:hypothetical protein